MRTFLPLLLLTLILQVQAQTRTYVGSANFGGTFFGIPVSQDNPADTLTVARYGEADIDLVIPALTFNSMSYTIPGFVIPAIALTYGAGQQSATLTAQDFTVNAIVEGKEKTYTGAINSGTIDADHLQLNLTFKYGSMPATITYDFSGGQVTALTAVSMDNATTTNHDLHGQIVTEPVKGQVYITNGKMMIIR